MSVRTLVRETEQYLSAGRRRVIDFYRRWYGANWQVARRVAGEVQLHPETVRRYRRELVLLGFLVMARVTSGRSLPNGEQSTQGTCVCRFNDAAHERQASKVKKVPRDVPRYSAPVTVAPVVAERLPSLPSKPKTAAQRRSWTAEELDAAIAPLAEPDGEDTS